MSGMVERVARAIWGDSGCCDYCVTDRAKPLPSDCCCYTHARAAIAAMRKPTEGMVISGAHSVDIRPSYVKTVLAAMIDAALQETETV